MYALHPPHSTDLEAEGSIPRGERGRGEHGVPRGRTKKGAALGREGGSVRITEEREKYLPPTLQEVNLGCSYSKAAKSIDWRLLVN